MCSVFLVSEVSDPPPRWMGYRLLHRANIKTTLDQCLVFAGPNTQTRAFVAL